MLYIFGLGNKDDKYERNRHNVGFLFLDYIQTQLAPKSNYAHDKLSNLEFLRLQDMTLIKPQSYMNNSGIAINSYIKKHKITDMTKVFVAHDDLDIALGSYKISFARGPKVHGGINSINHHLKTEDYTRIRIGVDARNPVYRLPGETYVLQDFPTPELRIVESVFPAIWTQLQSRIN